MFRPISLDARVQSDFATNEGGTITIPYSDYPSLSVDEEFMKNYSPLGVPGDSLYCVENYKVLKIERTLDSNFAHLIYDDSTIRSLNIEPIGLSLDCDTNRVMTKELSRLHLKITNITTDTVNWIHTVESSSPIANFYRTERSLSFIKFLEDIPINTDITFGNPGVPPEVGDDFYCEEDYPYLGIDQPSFEIDPNIRIFLNSQEIDKTSVIRNSNISLNFGSTSLSQGDTMMILS